MNSINLYFITLLVGCFLIISCKKEPIPMVITSPDAMVQDFYARNHKSLFWFSSKKKNKKAVEWLTEIETAHRYGIASDHLKIDQLRSMLLKKGRGDNLLKEHADQQITELVLHYLKELQEGNASFDFDEVRVLRDSVYVVQLLTANQKVSVAELIARIDCKDLDYLVLKNYLNDSITSVDTLKYQTVIKAMNYHRSFAMNGLSEYIVVNIPETVARYYRDGSLSLQMRTVVGRKGSPTPTIASHIKTIITFPHWNVPHSITVKEMLPKIQKDEIYLENNNLTVVDAVGIEVLDLDWMDYTEKNFPYFIRQSTGSRNALGVLKFDFENPYSVYLHSTNSQSGFLRDNRFLSHGCIRLEKPIDLANILLRGKLDVAELETGKKDTKSVMIELPQKVPVFIIYSPVSVEGNKVTFLPDAYGLIK